MTKILILPIQMPELQRQNSHPKMRRWKLRLLQSSRFQKKGLLSLKQIRSSENRLTCRTSGCPRTIFDTYSLSTSQTSRRSLYLQWPIMKEPITHYRLPSRASFPKANKNFTLRSIDHLSLGAKWNIISMSVTKSTVHGHSLELIHLLSSRPTNPIRTALNRRKISSINIIRWRSKRRKRTRDCLRTGLMK